MAVKSAVVVAIVVSCAMGMPIGFTPPELTEFGVVLPFADLLKHAAPFVARQWSSQLQSYSFAAADRIVYANISSFGVPVSTAGYPLRISSGVAAVLAIAPQPDPSTGHPPIAPAVLPGRYVLRWRGRGSLRVHGDVAPDAAAGSPPLPAGRAWLYGSNMAVAAGAPGGSNVTELPLVITAPLTRVGVLVAVNDTDGGDPLRGLELLPAPLLASGARTDRGPAAFAPRFLALARRFARGPIRFAAWQREVASDSRVAEGSKDFTWAARPRLDAPTQVQALGGVALEHAIDLALAVPHASPWFALPQRGSAAFTAALVRELALAFVLAPPPYAEHAPAGLGLGPTASIYLEYSSGVGLAAWQAGAALAAFDAAEQGMRDALADAAAGRVPGATTAAAAGAVDFPALRARFRLVVSVGGKPGFVANVLDLWAAPAAAAAAASNASGSLPAHPFARADAVAVSGLLDSQLDDAGWESPAANLSGWMARSDADLLAALRHAALSADVDYNALANRARAWALPPGSNGDDPAAAGRAGAGYVGGLPRVPDLLVYDLGWGFRPPDFGARSRLAATPAANVTAELRAVAALEAAAADRLAALHRSPGAAGILEDFARRLRAAGFTAAAAADALRPASPAAFTPSLALRRSGNAATAEGWHLAHGPYMAALAASQSPGSTASSCAALAVNASRGLAPYSGGDGLGAPEALIRGAATPLVTAAAVAGFPSDASASAMALTAAGADSGARPLLAALNITAAAAAPLLAGPAAAPEVACFVDALVSVSPKLRALLAVARTPDARPATAAQLPRALRDVSAALRACPPGGCGWGTCWNGTCVCHSGVTGANCSALAAPGDARGGASSCAPAATGVNVGGLSDYTTQQLFVDVGKQARAWIPQAGWKYHAVWAWGALPALGADDYPTAAGLSPGQALASLMLRDLDGHYSPGWYTVAWEGDGVVDVAMADVAEVRRDAPGRMRVRLVPGTSLNNGLLLRVERSSAVDPVRAIRVIAPYPGAPVDMGAAALAAAGAPPSSAAVTGAGSNAPIAGSSVNGTTPAGLAELSESSTPLAAAEAVLAHAAAFPFHPTQLAHLRRFPVLRLMEAQATNEATAPRNWSSRPLPSDRTYTLGRGLPAEAIVALGNALGAHLWVNVPHAADDGYVAAFAAALRGGLRPNTSVFVELSNELWASNFPGGQYAQAAGVAAGMDALSTIASGPDEARFCWYASRSAAVFEIFARAWGGPAAVAPRRGGTSGSSSSSSSPLLASSPAGVLHFVISSQAVNADVARRILACNASMAGRAATALAIAPYFDPGTALSDGSTTLTSLFTAALPAGINRSIAAVAAHVPLAAAYNLSLITYEAGQGMVGTASAAATALLTAANRDPRMRGLYARYYAGLAGAGSRLGMQFTAMGLPSRYGAWGLVEAPDAALPLNSSASPKLAGMADYWATLTDSSGGWRCPRPADDREVVSGADADDLCPQSVGEGGETATCGGRGTCIDAPVPGARGKACACDAGWTGAACEVGAFLDYSTCSYKCSGHGRCALQRTEGFRRFWGCECDAGYAGASCTIFACPNHCSWNGLCVDANRCSCYDGYGGADCSLDCGARSTGACSWQRRINGSSAAPATAAALAALPPAAQCDAGYAFIPDDASALPADAGGAAVAAFVLRGPSTAEPTPWYRRGACEPVCPGGCAAGSRCLRPGVCSCAGGCAFGDCIRGACACWAGYGGRTCSRRLRPLDAAAGGGFQAAFSPMGVNLGGVAYWSSETPFCDFMRTGSGWLSQYKEAWRPFGVYTWDRGAEAPLNLTADSYPAELRPDQAAATLLVRDVARTIPDGRWAVTYAGSGEISVGFDARATSVRRGRLEFTLRLSPEGVRDNGILLRVEDTDPRDPVRDVRVFPLDGEGGCGDAVADGFPFHAAFLRSLRAIGFGALRFMDWAATNGEGGRVREWAQRPTPAHAHWGAGTRGVPLEVMVHLANVLGAEPWLNMPHNASSGYVAGAAAVVLASLRPDLPVTIERSNEAWNALFDAGKALYAEAAAAGVSAPALHAAKSAAMAAAWERVWGADARAARVTHVLSTFTANPWYTRQLLRNASHLATVDALGVTAYMDCGDLGSDRNAALTAQHSAEWVLARCEAVLPSIARAWDAHADAVREALAAAANATAAAVLAGASPSPAPSSSATPSAIPAAGSGADPSIDLGFDSGSNATASSGSSSGSSNSDGIAPIIGGAVSRGRASFSSSSSSSASAASARRSLPIIVYEGGPSLAESAVIERPGHTPTAGLEELFTAVARHAGMERLYRAYLDSFGALGLARGRAASYPFMHFASGGRPSKYGAWGLLEATTQAVADSPKARAVAAFVREVVANATRVGCTSPAALNFDPQARFSSDNCTYAPVPVNASGASLQPEGLAVALSFPAGAITSGSRSVAISVAQVPVSVSLTSSFDGSVSNASVTNASFSSASTSTSAGSFGVPSSDGTREVATAVFRFGPPGTTFAAPVDVCVGMDAGELAALGLQLVADGAGSGNATVRPIGNSSSESASVDTAAAVGLYYSSDGRNWTLCQNSRIVVVSGSGTGANATAQLCGQLWHFTLVAGLAVDAAQIRADAAVAAASVAAASSAPLPSNGGGGGGGGGNAGVPSPSPAMGSGGGGAGAGGGGGSAGVGSASPSPGSGALYSGGGSSSGSGGGSPGAAIGGAVAGVLVAAGLIAGVALWVVRARAAAAAAAHNSTAGGAGPASSARGSAVMMWTIAPHRRIKPLTAAEHSRTSASAGTGTGTTLTRVTSATAATAGTGAGLGDSEGESLVASPIPSPAYGRSLADGHSPAFTPGAGRPAPGANGYGYGRVSGHSPADAGAAAAASSRAAHARSAWGGFAFAPTDTGAQAASATGAQAAAAATPPAAMQPAHGASSAGGARGSSRRHAGREQGHAATVAPMPRAAASASASFTGRQQPQPQPSPRPAQLPPGIRIVH